MGRFIESFGIVLIITIVFFVMSFVQSHYEMVKKEKTTTLSDLHSENPLDSYPAREGDECWIVVDGIAKYQFKFTNGKWLYWLETEEENNYSREEKF